VIAKDSRFSKFSVTQRTERLRHENKNDFN
jgi:hypothetical protein